jgi:hypothetical protein
VSRPGCRVAELTVAEVDRERLRSQGVTHWSVGVVEANEGATRLYERAGFKPFYRDLLAPL